MNSHGEYRLFEESTNINNVNRVADRKYATFKTQYLTWISSDLWSIN